MKPIKFTANDADGIHFSSHQAPNFLLSQRAFWEFLTMLAELESGQFNTTFTQVSPGFLS